MLALNVSWDRSFQTQASIYFMSLNAWVLIGWFLIKDTSGPYSVLVIPLLKLVSSSSKQHWAASYCFHPLWELYLQGVGGGVSMPLCWVSRWPTETTATEWIMLELEIIDVEHHLILLKLLQCRRQRRQWKIWPVQPLRHVNYCNSVILVSQYFWYFSDGSLFRLKSRVKKEYQYLT